MTSHALLMKLTCATSNREKRMRKEHAQYFDCCQTYFRPQSCSNFFQHPRNFLRSAAPCEGNTVYLIERLPDIGINFERLSQYLRLSLEEIALLREQFWPLTFAVQDQSCHERIRNIFCKDMIDEALDGVRSLCRPFNEICGRRLYLSAQGLAEELDEMRQTLEQRPNYQVCFVPREWFDRLGMELVLWEMEAAIVWIPGRQSIAYRDYSSLATLHSSCAAMWNNIPAGQRSRKAALEQLERWVLRAGRLGLIPYQR